MENSLQIFESEEFGKLHAIFINGLPYFVGKDVATALEYKDTDQAIRVNVDYRDKIILKQKDLEKMALDSKPVRNTGLKIDSPRGLIFINESGLFSLILSSKLPKAKEYRHWVTSKVLPSIHSKGYYISPKIEKEIIVETPPTEFTPPTAISAFKDITTIMQIMKQYWGMPHEIAKLKAILTVEKSYNINLDYLKDTVPSINEDEKKLFSPTQLGALTGKSAQYVNKRLCSLGFQKKDFKGGYILTDKGKEYGKLVFYETNGHKYHQIKWDYCMVRLI